MNKRTMLGLALGVTAAAITAVAVALVAGPLASAGGGPTVEASDVSISSGGTGKIEVRSTNIDPPGVGAYTIDISYDPAVLNVESCTPHSSGVCNDAFASNVIRVAGADDGGLTGTTVLASIVFSCKLQNGTNNGLGVVIDELFDATEETPEPIVASTDNGSVTCTQGPTSTPGPTATTVPTATPGGNILLGDVNCDGLVNAIDATLVLQFAAGLIQGFACPQNADVSQDGSVNALDALFILQISAGLIPQP